jgi:hypothetical protein
MKSRIRLSEPMILFLRLLAGFLISAVGALIVGSIALALSGPFALKHHFMANWIIRVAIPFLPMITWCWKTTYTGTIRPAWSIAKERRCTFWKALEFRKAPKNGRTRPRRTRPTWSRTNDDSRPLEI